ncbi:hypothetical protein J7K28_08265 [Candidatus Aerophobetes bacterium]|nr:hypothetical protein [Candidatus Aerophobetes bacterium]
MSSTHLSDFEKLDNDKIHLGWKFALVKEFEKKMWINLSEEKWVFLLRRGKAKYYYLNLREVTD